MGCTGGRRVKYTMEWVEKHTEKSQNNYEILTGVNTRKYKSKI